eukprot:4015367-Lingulodinium_polyedra.AAC.1
MVVGREDWHGVDVVVGKSSYGVEQDWLEAVVQLQSMWCNGFLYAPTSFSAWRDLPEVLAAN